MDKELSFEDILSSTISFTPVKEVYDEMLRLYEDIMADKDVCEVIGREIHMRQPSGEDVDINYKVMLVIFIDMVKCYQNMGHIIDFENKDTYILQMVTNLKFRENITTEIQFNAVMKLDSVEFIYKNLLKSFEVWARNDGKEFLFTRYAKEASVDLCNRYVAFMLLASNYIKRATPGNIREEYKWTSELRFRTF